MATDPGTRDPRAGLSTNDLEESPMPSRHSTRRPCRFQIEFDFEPVVHKRCALCREFKLFEQFHRTKYSPDGRVWRCKACIAAKVCKGVKRRRDELAADGKKACSKCGAIKPFTDFSASRTAKHGRKSNCKACHYQADKARLKANPEARRAWEREYDRRDPEATRARRKKKYDANPEAYRDRSRKYNAAHKAKVNERSKRYGLAHPEVGRELRRRRRARLKLVSSMPISAELLGLKVAYWGGRCWMCGEPGSEIDHVKPISKGGPHLLANLRPACRTCNLKKRDKWPFKKGDIQCRTIPVSGTS